ncbi:hypothetical protein MM213_17100 [Belliella sp. R4-6]|uniref:Uncharacterized protein n=1 Tax=Belliella alkalica TaxID=1730871 RepID=A0ABS9VFI9_9BACT|nr:hypothetical protein [Belliella alkalica]MCH7415220.1 hypothetical protein [Belliella alkalica]
MGWVINPEGVELLQSIDKVSSYFNSKPPISFGFCFRPHTDKDVRIKISKGKEILCFGCFEEVFFGIGIEKPILSKGI